MKNAKFIMVKDVDVANKLISSGFQFVSNTNNVYTFMNTVPVHFNFSEIDTAKLVYTNTLMF
jgi:hypothetical protein